MRRKLTPRGRDLHWLTRHRGLTEDPPGSNSDRRKDGIRAAQLRLGAWLVGQAWCGTWAANALLAAGVDFGHTPPSLLAGVANIEDLARAKRKPFGRGWTTDPRRALRGDLVVLFGRGVHVETVRRVFPRLGLILSDGGNTGPGSAGSQANGGGAFRRWRKFSDVHGLALVNYPGGPR